MTLNLNHHLCPCPPHSDMRLLYSSCTSVLEHSSPVRLCLWCRNVVMHQFRNEKRKRKRKNNYPTAEYAIHNFSSKFGIRTTTELGGKQVVSCISSAIPTSAIMRGYRVSKLHKNYMRPTVKM